MALITLGFYERTIWKIPNAIDRVNAAWDRVEALLPDDALGAPATEVELGQLEKDLGLALPGLCPRILAALCVN